MSTETATFQHIIYQFLKFISFNNPSKIDLLKGTELIDCQVNIKSTLLDNSINISKAVELRVKLDIIGGKDELDMVLSFKFIDGDISLQRKFGTFTIREDKKRKFNEYWKFKDILIEEVANDYRRAIRENFDMEINIKEVNQLNQLWQKI
ncbi:hypothetical protein ACTA71_005522 [Dictyostelium dimigraforme]